MVFRRRKLLNDSVQIIAINCTHFCDPKTNPNGLCPLPCLPFCFVNCKSTLLLPQDPPPPGNFADLNSHPVKHFRASLFLTVFLSILATSFFLFSFYTVHKLYRNWRGGGSGRSQRHPEEDGNDAERFGDFVDDDHGLTVDHPIWHIRTVGLQPSIINAIAVCKYKRGEGLVEGTECAVCLNEFQDDETLRLLPKCNHAFHIPCIDTWLRSHTNCPLCRSGIVSNTVVAAVPAAEQSLQSSVPVQEPETLDEEQIEIETAEIEREARNELSSNEEIRANNATEEENENENEAQIGIKRSFSLDSVSALMVSAAVVKAFADESAGSKSNTQKKAETQKDTSSSSSSSSSSLMPGLMKRSLSCGGKVFSSRYNRRPSAILPR